MSADRGQLGLDALVAMPQRLYRATPTRLLSWQDCPRRYRFTYLERPTPQKGPPWAHNSLGACVHTALASWWRLPPDQRTVRAAGGLVESGWIDEGFRDRQHSERWRARAREMVTAYVERIDPTEEPVGVERTVTLKTHGLALSGRIDRIDERVVRRDNASDTGDSTGDGPELVVVDYKSGRRQLTTADARTSLALAIYAAAASHTLRRPCRRVELHHLPTGAVVAWDHDRGPDGSLAEALTQAEAIGAAAAAADEAFAAGLSPRAVDEVFPPRPGPQCRWCDFSAHCPQGRQAYPTGRPWDGLDET